MSPDFRHLTVWGYLVMASFALLAFCAVVSVGCHEPMRSDQAVGEYWPND